MQTFPKYLKTIREKAGVTQGQLAIALGYSTPQFISNVERGVSGIPVKKIKAVALLCKAEPKEVLEHYKKYACERIAARSGIL